MQILVIGATGYAGRRVSAALTRAGHTVLGLARDTSAPAARALTVDEVTPVEGDFAKPETWRGHLDGTDAVVHLLLDMSDPVGGDRRLFAELLAAQERDGRRRHLVFTTGISSCGRTGLPLMDENTPRRPREPHRLPLRAGEGAGRFRPRPHRGPSRVHVRGPREHLHDRPVVRRRRGGQPRLLR
ncbi:SDR family oxidoreductase [Streptomyces sp. NPDC088116]|uniref:SDR family oxidoreductase n=1 Tax=Streptomyces sp. NPDC088116 TaxID=3365825 RepID=UPI003813EB7A